jgi:hypothetical protein
MTCAALPWLVPATIAGLLLTAAALLIVAAWIIHRRADALQTVWEDARHE